MQQTCTLLWTRTFKKPMILRAAIRQKLSLTPAPAAASVWSFADLTPLNRSKAQGYFILTTLTVKVAGFAQIYVLNRPLNLRKTSADSGLLRLPGSGK